MQALNAAALLQAWEHALGEPPVRRALTLLSAASPEMPLETLASLSIGERDARLLTLREWTFGPQLSAVATCPSCRERVEFSLSATGLRVAGHTLSESLSLDLAGYQLRFRLPNSMDLAAIGDLPDVSTARRVLFERCLLEARQNNESCTAAQIPPEVVEAVADQIARADPQADVAFALTCARCAHEWTATFDIAAYFWREVNAWAQRILREVHALASAYGWRESDILAMSSWRRQCYLSMVSG